MNLFGLLEVSGSALAAERIRAEVTTVNMANAETTRTAAGGPYRRQQVVFQEAGTDLAQKFGGAFVHQVRAQGHFQNETAAGGVEIAAVISDESEPIKRYDPQHPDADKNGFVSFPDINPLTEMVDLMGASRAYGLNSSAIQATKGMIAASLDILK
jgi:flagellar basal-body rod protein FlgC